MKRTKFVVSYPFEQKRWSQGQPYTDNGTSETEMRVALRGLSCH